MMMNNNVQRRCMSNIQCEQSNVELKMTTMMVTRANKQVGKTYLPQISDDKKEL